MFNKDIILIKLLLQTLDRIFEYTADYKNPDDFAADYKTFDATLMNFVALGETVAKLSEPFRDKYQNIEWRKIYAFRNIIAHDYFGVDEDEVWGIIQKQLPKLKTDLEAIVNQHR